MNRLWPIVLVLVALSLLLAASFVVRIDDSTSVEASTPAHLNPSPDQANPHAFAYVVPTTTTTTTSTTTAPKPKYTKSERTELLSASVGPCGGDLPPCSRMLLESGGDLRVWNNAYGCADAPIYYPVGYAGENRCGSTASGKWQFIRSTWANFRGYLNAADAPEEVQDERARQIWANGRGCSHWDLCG